MSRFPYVLFIGFVGCAGASTSSTTPPTNPETTATQDSDPTALTTPSDSQEAASNSAGTEAKPESLVLPSACANASGTCVMPRSFVKKLCAGAHPEIALYFFAKDSPWSRIFVSARQVEPYNGLNGPSSDQNLVFDEELLVLSENSPNLGGMTVSGVGNSYDVLRWDGTCATLQSGEVRPQRPPSPKHANIEWNRLDEEVRNALLADSKIAEHSKRRRQECKGVTMGAVSDKCEKADTALRARIVAAIREGLTIPKPAWP